MQRVRFRIQKFTTRQILVWMFYNASNFRLKLFYTVSDLVENQAINELLFDYIYLTKVTHFAFFGLSQKAWFRLLIITTCEFLKEIYYKASRFVLKISNVSVFEGNVSQWYRFGTGILQRGWFWIRIYAPFQVCRKLCLQKSRIVLFYSV